MKNLLIGLIFSTLLLTACRQAAPTTGQPETKTHLSPEERYGELFVDVQMGELFPDSKTFVDCTPKASTDDILAAYAHQKLQPEFDLRAFVEEQFILPKQYASGFESDTSRTAAEHINVLWDVLTRKADDASTGTLLTLPKSYVVPGGRFGEVYYWDSYFTILGLESAGRWELIENMADNFSFLIDQQGFVPNGNRTYYLGRSQPPFYSLIVKVLANHKGEGTLSKYLPYLQKEYDFWMDGLTNLRANAPTFRRMVRLPDGALLNRYYDDRPVPRPESYREDVHLAESIERPAEEVYRDIRAACESGWDFSSRWFADGQYMASIHTTEIIPVDLNALLYHLELTLAEAYTEEGDEEAAEFHRQRGANRLRALQQYCWDAERGFFYDYDFVARSSTGIPSLAAVYPLFFEMVRPGQADSVAIVLKNDFLKPGGLVTSLNDTGQQWDAPNGWAPLQWLAIQGLRNYEQMELADSIANNWTQLNVQVYERTGKMVEKYNVMDMSLEAGGGEYPVQDGFGWTNGVLLRLLQTNDGEIK